MVEVPARPAQFGAFPEHIPGPLRSALIGRGVERPYTHQVEAWKELRSGHDIVVVSPTASGKTLCYNVPVLEALLDGEDPGACALYLFPTKALGQDQVAELNALVSAVEGHSATPLPDMGAWTYDGDTPGDARRAIREKARVIVTNPDMLHTGLLPHHARWARLWQKLRYVVVDELHTYRGVFGSHVANVLRRLRRICEFHGGRPRFICASATIANPGELASGLIDRPVRVVDQSGAPTGARWFLFYNPPVVNKQLGIRRSYVKAATGLAAELLSDDVETIVFALSRRNAELIYRYVGDRLRKTPDGERRAAAVRAYRGGYLPGLRREIERNLRSGDIKGVITTNALELGIDIGQLDASIIAGYPGTVASTWQQAGRAGRRSEASIAVFVARSNPLDQFMVMHPEYFFGASPEHGRINPDNLNVLVAHIKCAAYELPFRVGEHYAGHTARDTEDVLSWLENRRVVHRSGERWHWMQDAFPAQKVNLRNISEENFVVVDTTGGGHRVLAEVDYDSAPTTIHQKAIYLVESDAYYVERLDWPERTAYVRTVDSDYFTTAMTHGSVEILDAFDRRTLPLSVAEHGEVKVVSRVVGFKKIRFHSGENIGYGEVDLPDQQMHTTAAWITPDRASLLALPYARPELIDGLLGLSYAMHHVAAFTLMCDVQDLGRTVGDKSAGAGDGGLPLHHGQTRGRYGRAESAEGQRVQDTSNAATDAEEEFDPTIFIYDRYPGGVGLAPGLFEHMEQIVRGAQDNIMSCVCDAGCPSCVGPSAEKIAQSPENYHCTATTKAVALSVLEVLMTGLDPLKPQREGRPAAPHANTVGGLPLH